jgi:hypothetical protein
LKTKTELQITQQESTSTHTQLRKPPHRIDPLRLTNLPKREVKNREKTQKPHSRQSPERLLRASSSLSALFVASTQQHSLHHPTHTQVTCSFLEIISAQTLENGEWFVWMFLFAGFFHCVWMMLMLCRLFRFDVHSWMK